MQLVLRIDLEKTSQSPSGPALSDVLRILAESIAQEDPQLCDGASGSLCDSSSRVMGEWQVEEREERPKPQDRSYRAAAAARYAKPREVEVDRFAPVSATDGGAFVQGWLFVPQAELAAPQADKTLSRKPPQSVRPISRGSSKTG